MEKRYQVFISSTFSDLQEERQEVIQALLELDCIPAGMELFPAADDDQWTLIKKVIDDCDYYIVVIGGRYGSLSSSGISYTQMEFEYAISQNKPVISFLHKDPDSIASGKAEQTEEGKQKLAAFRAILEKAKTCRYWLSPSELSGVVSRSLIKQIKEKPAIGWVRADAILDESTADEILNLRKRNSADEISKIASELSKIKESLSTHYIGSIKDYLPQVLNEIKNAKRSIAILCDFPAYGYFTDHDDYNDYCVAIRKKLNNPNIKVSLMCLDKDSRADSNRKVFRISKDNWEEWKRDGEHNNLLHKLGYSSEDISKLSMDEFLEALESVDQEMLKVYCKGAHIEEVSAFLTFDFWLFDEKRLIFAFSTYAGDESQYGFFTEDTELISAFTEIKDRYHRKKVEDGNIERGK